MANETTLIMLFSGISVLFTGAFTYVVYLFRNRKVMEYSEERMRRLEWQKSMLGEYERYLNELSFHIHNKVQQQALVIKHSLDQVNKVCPRGVSIEIAQVMEYTDELIRDSIQINKSINLEYLRSQSLRNLIENELMNANKISEIEYQLEYKDDPDFDGEVKIIIYRILQEAINNVVKHAIANFLKVSMLHIDGKFIFSVEDNGIGLNQEKIYGPPTHGFANMRSRAAMINATLAISSEEMGGTRITLEMHDLK